MIIRVYSKKITMVNYHCRICSKEFSMAGGLKQHGKAKHNGRTSLFLRSYTRSQRLEHTLTRPEHNKSL